jgi:hypothetical protein
VPRILALVTLVLAQVSICDFFPGCELCASFSVNAGGSKQVLIDQQLTLTGHVTGGLPPFTFQWTQIDGEPAALDDDTSQSTDVIFATPGERTYRITVTDADGKTVFADVLVKVVLPPSNLVADAGEFRWLRPQGPAFSGGVPFGSAQTLTLNGLFGTDRLQATVSDDNFPASEQTIIWQAVSTPPPATTSKVTIPTASALSSNVLIAPVGAFLLPVLQANGLTGDLPNTVVPGIYRFGIQVTNPLNDMANDQVEYGILPAVDLNANGDPNGVALAHGELTHAVLPAGGNATLRYAVLASIDVTLAVRAEDAAPGPASFPLANVNIPVNEPQATFSELDLPVNLGPVPADTYRVQFTWTDILDTFDAIKADQWLHLQPPLPSGIDVADIGVINPNGGGASLHGFIGGSLFAGTCAIQVDVNGDGIAELITAGAQGAHLIWTTGPTDLPNSAIDNADAHDGDGPDERAVALTLPAGFVPWKAVVCDLNRDGHPDLAISDPSFGGPQNPGDGVVLVLYHNGSTTHGGNPYAGGSSALFASPAGTHGALGYGLAGGDYNGDGYDDLAIGEPNYMFDYTLGAGRAWVILASDEPPIGQALVENIADAHFQGTAWQGYAGLTVGFANLTSASGKELVVCSPRETAYEYAQLGGRIRIFPAGQLGELSAYKQINGDVAQNFLGRRLAIGDFNGNGQDEIFASAAFGTSGRVYVIPDSHPGGALGTVQFVAGSPGQNLGAELGCGDTNHDGRCDLLITAPGLGLQGGAKSVPEPLVVLVLGQASKVGNALSPTAIFDEGVNATAPLDANLLDESETPVDLRLDAINTDYAALVDWNGDGISDIMFGQAAGHGVGLAASQ